MLQHRRQIAALHQDEASGDWSLSRITSKATHHYNPFLSVDGTRLGYHRCRCFGVEDCEAVPVLEHHSSVLPGLGVACSGAPLIQLPACMGNTGTATLSIWFCPHMRGAQCQFVYAAWIHVGCGRGVAPHLHGRWDSPSAYGQHAHHCGCSAWRSKLGVHNLASHELWSEGCFVHVKGSS